MSITDGSNPLKSPLPLFLFQMLFIILVARALGLLLKKIKQPQVVAEVITGLLLGPSALGQIPNFTSSVFPSSSLETMYVVSNVGLIFFMFLIGLELDPTMMKKNLKPSVVIAVSSMAVPFGVGAALAYPLHNFFLDDHVPFSSFLLFVGVALCVTAFPVLARILAEERMTTSELGIIALASAAINDVIAWILLALVVSVARSSGKLNTLWVILIMTGFIGLMLGIIKPLMEKLNRRPGERTRELMLVATILLIICASWVTEVIGIHAIFGGFLSGLVIPREGDFSHFLYERIEDLVVVMLLPLYFTYSGLRVALTSLNTWTAWGACLFVILMACGGKMVGTMAGARFLSYPWRESVTLGVLMNTKGLVELIVLNIGLDVGVLNQELFSIFVMMALVTTMITSPLLYLIWTRHVEAPKKDTYEPLLA